MTAPSNHGTRVGRALLVAVFALVAAGIAAPDAAGAAATAATEPDLSASVVGGKPIGRHDYPELAAIMVAYRDFPPRERLLCTGTVIAKRWVLTAGHCSTLLMVGIPLVVQLGSPDLGDPAAVTIRINRGIVHRAYWARGSGFDVALMHLQENAPGPYSRLAVAADIPLMAPGRTSTVVGWGLTKRIGIGEFPDPTLLPPITARAADIPIVGDGPCADVYRDVAPRYFAPMSDLCAGVEGRNVCYGDSGGPMYATDPQGQRVQIGITSRGQGCATRLFPSIFTDVRRLHGWIHRYTTRPCPTRATFPIDPGFPDEPPLPLGALFVC